MLMSPILDVAYDLQSEHGDISLKATPQGSGSWTSNLCVNATTKCFHTEKDCTYTLISVPRQKKSMGKFKFLFQLNDENLLVINLNPDVAVLFSGLLVTHRQTSVRSNKKGNMDDIYINVSSYGNQRLFCHIKKSFERMKQGK